MDREAKVVEMYRRVPEMACKGLCQEACGPIMMSLAEQQILLTKYGSLPTVDDKLTCSKLVDGKCSIYEDRPLVCRLFGAVGGMPCPHGCKPAEGRISDKVARRWVQEMERI